MMNEQKTSPLKPAGRFFSLRLKIWIGFILIFTPVFVASYYWFYEYTSARVFDTITTDLQDTLTGAIQGMDKDGFVKLYEEESTDNPACPPEKPTADTPKDKNGYYRKSKNEKRVSIIFDPEQRIMTCKDIAKCAAAKSGYHCN